MDWCLFSPLSAIALQYLKEFDQSDFFFPQPVGVLKGSELNVYWDKMMLWSQPPIPISRLFYIISWLHLNLSCMWVQMSCVTQGDVQGLGACRGSRSNLWDFRRNNIENKTWRALSVGRWGGWLAIWSLNITRANSWAQTQGKPLSIASCGLHKAQSVALLQPSTPPNKEKKILIMRRNEWGNKLEMGIA